MATALDIISGSLKLLGVRPAEGPIEDVEAQDGLIALNDMMAEWELRGILVGYEAVDDVDEELFLDAGADGAIKANLAIWIAPEYGRVVSDELRKRAERGIISIYGAAIDFSTEFPDSLPIGSGNETARTSSNGDVPNSRGRHFYPPNVKDSCG